MPWHTAIQHPAWRKFASGYNRIAKGLEVMALADDGLTEAVYMPEHPYVWAVQWHPELSLKDETSKKFFLSFVRNVEKSAQK